MRGNHSLSGILLGFIVLVLLFTPLIRATLQKELDIKHLTACNQQKMEIHVSSSVLTIAEQEEDDELHRPHIH